jgi:hypothetical protein
MSEMTSAQVQALERKFERTLLAFQPFHLFPDISLGRQSQRTKNRETTTWALGWLAREISLLIPI